MPIRVTLEAASRLVVFQVSGDPGIQEMIDSVEAALRHPSYRTGFSFLSDRRRVDHPPSNELLAAAVAFLEANQARLGAPRWAFVVSDVENYRIARKAAILSESTSTQVEVFASVSEARKWLSEDSSAEIAQGRRP